MDSIRWQQIAEVLNYDRNLNLLVTSLEKKGVEQMAETGSLSSLQKQYVIDDANELINTLVIMLDKKRADVTSRPHYSAAHGKQHTNSVDELAKIHEVVDAYNEIMVSYLANNSAQTTQIMHEPIRRVCQTAHLERTRPYA